MRISKAKTESKYLNQQNVADDRPQSPRLVYLISNPLQYLQLIKPFFKALHTFFINNKKNREIWKIALMLIPVKLVAWIFKIKTNRSRNSNIKRISNTLFKWMSTCGRTHARCQWGETGLCVGHFHSSAFAASFFSVLIAPLLLLAIFLCSWSSSFCFLCFIFFFWSGGAQRHLKYARHLTF